MKSLYVAVKIKKHKDDEGVPKFMKIYKKYDVKLDDKVNSYSQSFLNAVNQMRINVETLKKKIAEIPGDF